MGEDPDGRVGWGNGVRRREDRKTAPRPAAGSGRGTLALQDGGCGRRGGDDRARAGAVRRAACAEPICGAERWQATVAEPLEELRGGGRGGGATGRTRAAPAGPLGSRA